MTTTAKGRASALDMASIHCLAERGTANRSEGKGSCIELSAGERRRDSKPSECFESVRLLTAFAGQIPPATRATDNAQRPSTGHRPGKPISEPSSTRAERKSDFEKKKQISKVKDC